MPRIPTLALAALMLGQPVLAGDCDSFRVLTGANDGAAIADAGMLESYSAEPLLSARDVTVAERVTDPGGAPAVLVRLSEAATLRFDEATGARLGQPMAIVLNDRILSAPVVRARISSGRVMISGLRDRDEAEALLAAFETCAAGQE